MKRKREKLTDEQIEHLAELICQGGDDPEIKSRALLVLMDEIEIQRDAEDITHVVKGVAYPRCGDNHIAPYVQLLRGEIFK